MKNRVALQDQKGHVLVGDPPIAELLFSSTRLAWFWLIVRIWVGYQWFSSGLGKLSNPAWVSDGSALRGYWERAVAIPAAPAKPPVTFDWYRDFLNMLLAGNHEIWFAKLVVFGELAVGLGLFVGAFVGIAAFGGALMNWSFMMAGTASTNPVLLLASVGLMLAWKVAGYYGLDRFLLPMLGTPWRQVVTQPRATAAQAPATTAVTPIAR